MKNCPNCQSEVPTEFDICWKCNYDFLSKEIHEREASSEFIDEPHQVKNLKCLRCESSMEYFGEKKFHEGKRYGVWGEIGELFVNRTLLDMYQCPECGKVEFFSRKIY